MVGTAPAGNTSSVRDVLGARCRLIGTASVSPSGPEKSEPGPMVTSTSSRPEAGCSDVGVTITATSSWSVWIATTSSRAAVLDAYTAREPR